MKTITAFLCAIALSPLAALAADYGEISVDELKKAIAEKKVTLLDVNGSASYKDGHIPGAIDFSAEKDIKAKLPSDKSALVVAYCGNENCSAYARGAKAAADLGYTNVKHFKPGIAGWKSKGEKTEKGS
jgi:rhodanese-related sulfurtransferase